MTFFDFIALMLSPAGIGLATGALIFVLVDYTDIELVLAPRYKRALAFALSLVLPIAFSLLRLPFGLVELPVTWQTFFTELIWPALYAGAIAFAESQALHMQRLSPDPETPEDKEPMGFRGL